MLIGALQIEVGRVAQLLAPADHGGVGDAGIEPHIERVGHLDVLVRVGAK